MKTRNFTFFHFGNQIFVQNLWNICLFNQTDCPDVSGFNGILCFSLKSETFFSDLLNQLETVNRLFHRVKVPSVETPSLTC